MVVFHDGMNGYLVFPSDEAFRWNTSEEVNVVIIFSDIFNIFN